MNTTRSTTSNPEDQSSTRRWRKENTRFFTEVQVITITLLLVVAPVFLGGLRARLHTPIPHREPLTNTREVAINHEQSTRVGFGTPPRITTKPLTINHLGVGLNNLQSTSHRNRLQAARDTTMPQENKNLVLACSQVP